MSAATIARDETLELRLKALRLPSFLEQYIELAERAAAEGWSYVRYLAELVSREAEDRADRRISRLLHDAKLPRDKSVATLDLNRYEAPLRGKVRELLRGEFLAGATNVCLIGRPGTGKSHVMAALARALVEAGRTPRRESATLPGINARRCRARLRRICSVLLFLPWRGRPRRTEGHFHRGWIFPRFAQRSRASDARYRRPPRTGRPGLAR